MKPSVSLLILFFSVTTTLLNSFEPTSASRCHVDDQQGLLSFKSGITHDPSGMLSSWTPSTHCCTWAGVSCALDGHRVDNLQLYGSPDLPNSYLTGSISPSISKLQFLTVLTLQSLGNLSGPIPDGIVQLQRLESVFVENNKLSGPIPRGIGNLNRLDRLYLDGNRLQGSIPDSIAKLTHLTYLNLSNNLLTGPIPRGIKNLKNLVSLNLEYNQLSGTIPDIDPSLTELRYLTLSHNKLSGTIPPYLPKGLSGFTASHNELTGRIPSSFGDLEALQVLELSRNRLSGTVPANMSRLIVLDLSHNNLVGSLMSLNKETIYNVDLSYNNFNLGVLPDWITSAFALTHVGLAKCGIKSDLGEWKPENLNMRYLYTVDISENEVFGSPVSLFNGSKFLREFRASGNELKFNMGRLKIPKLMKVMDVSRNLAYGYVPKAVARLESFNASYNHLCGKIPVTNFTASALIGNDCLCGSPLPPCKVK